jgi:hypothetical protein
VSALVHRRGQTAAALACALAAAWVTACGSSATTAVSPSPVRCEITLTSTVGVATGTGGQSSIDVGTQPECDWTASTTATWISQLAPSSGQGPRRITFEIGANPEAVARQADIVVGDARFTVRQNAAACVFTIDPTSATAPVSGGGGTVAVTGLSGCVWTTVRHEPWITAVGSGNGNGSVTYTVAANSGPPRKGTLSVAGETFTVTQDSGCAFSVAPTSQSVDATGGTGSASVGTEVGCAWDARSEASWITLTSGAQGSGSGTVTFTVAAHTGPLRTGTLFIAGETFTVTQASGCTFSIQPAALASVPAGGQSGTTTVATSAGCAWTATTSESWITFPSGASSTGPGTLAFEVQPNTSPARSGSFFVQGQEFRITQAGGCTYALQATQASGAAGGSFSTPMNTGPGCPWTATSNAPWITLTSGSGAGPGPVSYTVGANTGPARQGTITAQGQTLTVSQASGCSFTVEPTSANVPAGGATLTTSVTTVAGCAWTASVAANTPWIAITAGASGSDSGSTSFTIQATNGPARTGMLTIAGQTFTVNQASGCTYVVPSSVSATVDGGAQALSIGTAGGCTWTAAVNPGAPWLSVSPGAGSGPQSVIVTAAPNTGGQRSGSLTVAGQTVTVTQAACTYSISPTSRSHMLTGGLGTVSVTTSSGCMWTATSDELWITVASGDTGTGPGTVVYSVLPNLLGSRTGTITIAGQTFTVIQD